MIHTDVAGGRSGKEPDAAAREEEMGVRRCFAYRYGDVVVAVRNGRIHNISGFGLGDYVRDVLVLERVEKTRLDEEKWTVYLHPGAGVYTLPPSHAWPWGTFAAVRDLFLGDGQDVSEEEVKRFVENVFSTASRQYLLTRINAASEAAKGVTMKVKDSFTIAPSEGEFAVVEFEGRLYDLALRPAEVIPGVAVVERVMEYDMHLEVSVVLREGATVHLFPPPDRWKWGTYQVMEGEFDGKVPPSEVVSFVRRVLAGQPDMIEKIEEASKEVARIEAAE